MGEPALGPSAQTLKSQSRCQCRFLCGYSDFLHLALATGPLAEQDLYSLNDSRESSGCVGPLWSLKACVLCGGSADQSLSPLCLWQETFYEFPKLREIWEWRTKSFGHLNSERD